MSRESLSPAVEVIERFEPIGLRDVDVASKNSSSLSLNDLTLPVSGSTTSNTNKQTNHMSDGLLLSKWSINRETNTHTHTHTHSLHARIVSSPSMGRSTAFIPTWILCQILHDGNQPCRALETCCTTCEAHVGLKPTSAHMRPARAVPFLWGFFLF